ncbi:MAG: endonuclease/exonuclease/phosphatase [Chitinophagaceae bacterium]|nr:endonuclease/exonuclease/phosphatase [Chitinophagaceae bacterium]
MKNTFITFLIFFVFFITESGFSQKFKSAIIGFYNLENLYDTVDNPSINDEEFTPFGPKNYNGEIYRDKLNKLAKVIAEMGADLNPDGPAILGVCEVENDTVLNDLANHPMLAQRKYRYVHYNSPDERGVDVALLYNPKYFRPDTSKNLFVQIPGGAKDAFFTRDILWIKGTLDGEIIHVYVNHWPSRRGGEERSEPAREAAASVARRHMDSVLKHEPDPKFILMGDLNDDPTNKSVTKVIGARAQRKNLKPGEMYNPWTELYKKGIGTLAYQDSWALFDQILISSAWLNVHQNGFFFYKNFIFNKDYMVENMGKYKGYPMRTWDGNRYRGGYSDHFPTYIVVLKSIEPSEVEKTTKK